MVNKPKCCPREDNPSETNTSVGHPPISNQSKDAYNIPVICVGEHDVTQSMDGRDRAESASTITSLHFALQGVNNDGYLEDGEDIEDAQTSRQEDNNTGYVAQNADGKYIPKTVLRRQRKRTVSSPSQISSMGCPKCINASNKEDAIKDIGTTGEGMDFAMNIMQGSNEYDLNSLYSVTV